MQTIFNTPAPSFNIEEALNIIRKEYDINGEIKELYSDRDQNFHIANKSKNFILKISNPAEQISVLDLQDKAVEYILKNHTNIQIPKRIGPIIQKEKDGKIFLVRLLNYIEGNFLHEKKITKNRHKDIGVFLAKLNNALEGFDHPGAHRKFDWDVRQTGLIEKKLKYIAPIDQKTICHFLNEFEKNIIPFRNELKMSIIHNDANDHNIMIDKEGKMIGIIDFGDMVYSYRALDPAICMAYIAQDNDQVLPYISSMLCGCRSACHLNQMELNSLPYLMCLRLCITVLMAAWRKRLFPKNKYLTISEKPAWKILRGMETINLQEWSDKMIRHAH